MLAKSKALLCLSGVIVVGILLENFQYMDVIVQRSSASTKARIEAAETLPLFSTINESEGDERGQNIIYPWNSTITVAGKPTFRYWNYNEQVLKLPEEMISLRRSSSKDVLSLEILEQVLKERKDDNSCFQPDVQRTHRLVEAIRRQDRQGALTFPVINVGMPKVGSTSLAEFFNCPNATTVDGIFPYHGATHDQEAACMHESAAEGKPPIQSCTTNHSAKAHLQLDCNWPRSYKTQKRKHCKGCSYPQISLLDEIHNEYPNASFILMFRPINDWIQSALGWKRNLVRRWAYCRIPGLFHAPNNSPLSEQHLKDWWCGHVHHVREFVRHHPSHALIELDLYDNDQTAQYLAILFGAEPSCWVVANKRNSTVKAESLRQNAQNALANNNISIT